jgi:hypothetical protein
MSRSLDAGAVNSAAVDHSSSVWFDSQCCAGVRYVVRRVSLGRRIDLARRLREIGRKLEFLQAGGAGEQFEAAVVKNEIERVYLEWGLEGLEGLQIDGSEATPELLIERGPLDLAEEILGRIKAESGLSEAERKN